MNGRTGGMKFQNRKGTPKMNNENISRSGDLSGIDLWELLRILLKRWRLLLLCTVAAAAVTLACTANFITPLYRASVMIYVNNVKSSQQVDYISASNLATSQQLVNTYVNIIRSRTVLEKVVEETGMNVTADDIRDMLSASSIDETEIFEVYVTSPNPEQAAEIANAVAQVAPGVIADIVEGSSTKVIDYAVVPTARYYPSFRSNTLVGCCIGGALAAAVLALRFMMDTSVKSEEDLEEMFQLPVLGSIPSFDGKRRKTHWGGPGNSTCRYGAQ